MKGIIFAAGLGERMGDLVKDVPKCLLPVKGVPMLFRWIQHLLDLGCDETWYNSHHHAHKVRAEVVQAFPEACRDGVLNEYNEHSPNGSGTSLVQIGRQKMELDRDSDEDIVLAYCDVYVPEGIDDLVGFHRLSGVHVSLGIYQTEEPQRCGIVELDGDDVIGVSEKPEEPKSDLAWGGVAVMKGMVVGSGVLSPTGFVEYNLDIAADFLPVLARVMNHSMKAYRIKSDVIDIGSPERYESVK